jgi:hypothetical protein
MMSTGLGFCGAAIARLMELLNNRLMRAPLRSQNSTDATMFHGNTPAPLEALIERVS